MSFKDYAGDILFMHCKFWAANHHLVVNPLPEEYLLPSSVSVQSAENNSPGKLIYKFQSKDSTGEALNPEWILSAEYFWQQWEKWY